MNENKFVSTEQNSTNTLASISNELMQLTLDTDLVNADTIGNTREGIRRIVPVTGGSFSGGTLKGTVKPGYDWVLVRADGTFKIDVRLTLTTDSGVLIYLTYQGRFLAEPEALARFAEGELLEPEDYSLVVTAKFECGDPAYQWLNDVVAVGIGEQLSNGVRYTFHQIG